MIFYFFAFTSVVSFFGLCFLYFKTKGNVEFPAEISNKISLLSNALIMATDKIRSSIKTTYLSFLSVISGVIVILRRLFRRFESIFGSHQQKLTQGAVSFYLAEIKDYSDNLKSAKD